MGCLLETERVRGPALHGLESTTQVVACCASHPFCTHGAEGGRLGEPEWHELGDPAERVVGIEHDCLPVRRYFTDVAC